MLMCEYCGNAFSWISESYYTRDRIKCEGFFFREPDLKNICNACIDIVVNTRGVMIEKEDKTDFKRIISLKKQKYEIL